MTLDTLEAEVAQIDERGAQVAYLQAPGGQLVRAWESYEALQQALPRGQSITRLSNGIWVRRVERGTNEIAQDEATGELSEVVELQDRRVALSMKQAQDARINGIEMDHWTGTTYGWFRRGLKPERDLAVMLARPEPGTRVLRPIAPSRRAEFDAVQARQKAAEMANVVPASSVMDAVAPIEPALEPAIESAPVVKPPSAKKAKNGPRRARQARGA